MGAWVRHPRVLQLSAEPIIGRQELFARVRRIGDLPPEARERVAVQLRDPELSGRDLSRFGLALREATRQVGARLIVNDRLDLAVALDADGVHLGRHSVAPREARSIVGDRWISVSIHRLEELDRADGADAIVLAPMFTSPGKEPLPPGTLARVRARLPRVGIIALGGITVHNAGQCFADGADGVAAVRADLVPLLHPSTSTWRGIT
jgi:thiamine-phosphate pyrophosphorylase